MRAVYWKELADFFGSSRFGVLLLLIGVASAWSAYTATQAVLDEAGRLNTQFIFLRLFTSSEGSTLTFLFFISIFGPLLALSLGFDAVNNERISGTLARILSQPIYRDALINGKFMAGITVLGVTFVSLMLVIVGVGLFTLGFSPTVDEMVRLGLFLGVTIVYLAVWLAVAILFSLLFDKPVVSAMASLGIWLLMTVFISFFAATIADQVAQEGEDQDPADQVRWEQRINRLSPSFLYEEATLTLLNPSVRTLVPISLEELQGIIPGPLPLVQSLTLVWAHISGLLAMAAVVFAFTYVKFMREEIRP